MCNVTPENAQNEADATLTTSDVARLLRVSQDTISRMEHGTLPFRKTPGGHRRYRYADVKAYAARELHIDLDAAGE